MCTLVLISGSAFYCLHSSSFLYYTIRQDAAYRFTCVDASVLRLVRDPSDDDSSSLDALLVELFDQLMALAVDPRRPQWTRAQGLLSFDLNQKPDTQMFKKKKKNSLKGQSRAHFCWVLKSHRDATWDWAGASGWSCKINWDYYSNSNKQAAGSDFVAFIKALFYP